MSVKYFNGVTWENLIPEGRNYEVKSNKVTSLSSSSTDKQYPSAKCVYDALQSSGGSDIFICTYGETTAQQIYDAIGNGLIPVLSDNGAMYTISFADVDGYPTNYRYLFNIISYVEGSEILGYAECKYNNGTDSWDNDTAFTVDTSLAAPITSSSTDEEIPTSKAVYDAVSGKISEPASEGTNGQVLTTDGNGGRTWTSAGGGAAEIYWCTYGTTTYAQIQSAVSTNKIPVCHYSVVYDGFTYDGLYIYNNSQSGVATFSYQNDNYKFYVQCTVGNPNDQWSNNRSEIPKEVYYAQSQSIADNGTLTVSELTYSKYARYFADIQMENYGSGSVPAKTMRVYLDADGSGMNTFYGSQTTTEAASPNIGYIIAVNVLLIKITSTTYQVCVVFTSDSGGNNSSQRFAETINGSRSTSATQSKLINFGAILN